MTKKPSLIDDNVEDMRRVRAEISAEFKTPEEFFEHVLKLERSGKRRVARSTSANSRRKSKTQTKPASRNTARRS